MATYRYLDVRRDIYEHCSDKQLKKLRTFSEVKRLFKKKYLVLMIILMLLIITGIIINCLLQNKIYLSIALVISVTLLIFTELFEDKTYNPSERKKELDKNSAALEKFIETSKGILKAHHIVTKEQLETLKKECENQLLLHSNNYKTVSNKVFDMLIGVPLGALISALIYKSNSLDVIISQILVVIVVGLTIIAILRFSKIIAFYYYGRFKDQYLLDVLNELEYLSE